jgi:dethiobiotin synthetase
VRERLEGERGVVEGAERRVGHHQHRRAEGAGGLLVRYDDGGATLADLARALGAPVLVVADPALGTLNHTALTLEALAHRGLTLAGVVLGSWPAEPDLACRTNIADLEALAARPLAGALPAGAGRSSRARFLTLARAGLSPALGGCFDASHFRDVFGR